MNLTPEQIAAFADGQLEGEDARDVAAAVAADPALQAQVAAHHALRARLSAHFAPLAQAPVPERLTAAVRGHGAEVIDLAARRRRPGRSWTSWRYAGPALAASLLVAVAGFHVWQGRDYAGGELSDALDRQLAMRAPAGAPIRVLLSFRDDSGQFCRAYRASASSGIACRDDRGWRMHPLPGATGEHATEFRQAGSEDAAIMAAAQAMATGPALDAQAEAAAARRGWRP